MPRMLGPGGERIEQLPSKTPFSKRFEEIAGEACESADASQVTRRSTCQRPRCARATYGYLER
jgi:hypothetical protein